MRVKDLIRTPVAVLFLGYAAGSIWLSIVADEFLGLILRLKKGKGAKNKEEKWTLIF